MNLPPVQPTNTSVRRPPIPAGVVAVPQAAIPVAPAGFNRGVSMVLYGPTKCGKTSFAAQWGRTGFMIDSQEQGIRYLCSRNLVPQPVFIEEFPNHPSSWARTLQFVRQSAARFDIDTLIIESLTGFQTICFLDHGKRRFSSQRYPDGDFSSDGFYSYQKGPKNAAQFDWPDFMEAVNSVLISGKNVIVTGHSIDKQETSVEGAVYQKNVPAAEKEIWVKLARWASIVAFMSPKVEQNKELRTLKKVAKPDMERFLYTEGTPYFEAGNWFGMQRTVISCGFSGKECFTNFMQAFQA